MCVCVCVRACVLIITLISEYIMSWIIDTEWLTQIVVCCVQTLTPTHGVGLNGCSDWWLNDQSVKGSDRVAAVGDLCDNLMLSSNCVYTNHCVCVCVFVDHINYHTSVTAVHILIPYTYLTLHTPYTLTLHTPHTSLHTPSHYTLHTRHCTHPHTAHISQYCVVDKERGELMIQEQSLPQPRKLENLMLCNTRPCKPEFIDRNFCFRVSHLGERGCVSPWQHVWHSNRSEPKNLIQLNLVWVRLHTDTVRVRLHTDTVRVG